jgi:TonB family protein
MNRLHAAVFIVLFGIVLSAGASFAQQEPTDSRKIVNRVAPQYPDLARSIHLGGSVKAEALVDSKGVVKSVEVRGGNPVLVQAAQNAIYKWKWAPAPHETREPVEVRFDPR